MKTILAVWLMVVTWGFAADPEQVEVTGLKVVGGERKYIEIEGAVALTNGVLEFIAVEPGGRDYESLFTIKAKPSALQFALLLIGAEPGKDPEAGMPKSHLPEYDKGSRLTIEVEWQVDGQTKRAPVSQFLRDRKTGQPAGKLEWVFCGSYFTKDLEGKRLFLGDAEQAHIALWWNSAIPINLVGDFGVAYQGGNQGFEVLTSAIPPAGTPVKLLLRQP